MFGRNKNKKTDYKRERRKHLLQDRASGIVSKLSGLKKYFIIALFIAAGAGLFLLFNNDKIFLVKSIEVTGTNRVDAKKVETVLESYKNKNMLKIKPSEVESKIKSKFDEVIAAYVSKDLNGTLKVDVIENTPVVAIISQNGIALLNSRAMNVGHVDVPQLKLTDTEIKANTGKLDLNDPAVKKKFQDDPANADKEWDKATNEDKQKYVDQFKNDAQNKMNDYFNNEKSILSQSIYSDLVKISDRKSLAKEISGESIEFVLKIQELILKIPLGITDIEYREGDTFIFSTDSGKKLIFYPGRSYLDQIRDLNVLITNGIFNGLSVIDFRTEKYSGI